MPDTIKIDLTNTPEKFHIMMEIIFPPFTTLLKELCRLENEYFLQLTRLVRKGRVIFFKDGVREEITQNEVLKAKYKEFYRQLLDPNCTSELLASRRDCRHGEHYPSDFNCLHTGCTAIFTMKSTNKAIIDLLPDDGSIPYNMSNPDVRYIAEGFTNNPPHFYIYLQMYRFTMKAMEGQWKIDAVHSKGSHDTHWHRDYYF